MLHSMQKKCEIRPVPRVLWKWVHQYLVYLFHEPLYTTEYYLVAQYIEYVIPRNRKLLHDNACPQNTFFESFEQ